MVGGSDDRVGVPDLAHPEAQAWRHEGHAWAALPVPTCVDATAVDPAWADEAVAVVEAWNDASERRLFARAPCEAAAVQIVLTPATDRSTTHTLGPLVDVDGCAYDEVTTATVEIGVAGLLHDAAMDTCTASFSFRRALAHELGHVLGLAHACEEGEACTDAATLGALMYWTILPCDDGYRPQTDDVAGIVALYTAPTCDRTLADPAEPHVTPHAPPEDPDRGCQTAPTPSSAAALLLLVATARRRRSTAPAASSRGASA